MDIYSVLDRSFPFQRLGNFFTMELQKYFTDEIPEKAVSILLIHNSAVAT